jgi:hypothetical protein
MQEKDIDVMQTATPKVNVMQGASAPEIPYELVPLPSQGKLYPEEHPLFGEESVQIKAMTATEENILSSPALIKKGTVVDTLIRSCLLNKSIDPKTLLAGDKSAILLAIRISGFGAEYTMKTSCPECSHGFDHNFDLSKVLVKPLNCDPLIANSNIFSFVLPKSKKTIKFKLLTSGDEMDISETQDKRRKALRKSGVTSEVETTVTDNLLRGILEIDGNKDRKFIEKFVATMPVLDSRTIREHIKAIQPDILFKEEVECPNCGAVETHDIPIGMEFLWPKL